jgi:DNA-binding CsgD family transcriptional regulator
MPQADGGNCARNLLPEHASGTVICMETDPTFAALDALRRKREAGKAAEKATPTAIVDALKAGKTAADIARHLGVSEGYVRGIRRENKLQDPRYAHLQPPRPTEG